MSKAKLLPPEVLLRLDGDKRVCRRCGRGLYEGDVLDLRVVDGVAGKNGHSDVAVFHRQCPEF